MSDKIQFSISKASLSAVALCLVLGGVLLFSAGIVTGLMVGPAAPKVSASALPLLPAEAKKEVAPAVMPKVGTSAKTVLAPVEPARTDAASMKSASADKPTESASDGSMRPTGLVVQVASFLDRGRAQRFADSLKRQGFGQSTVADFEAAKQTWHVVRLGPYRDWDSASQVAAEVGRTYDLQCSVRNL